MTRREVLGFLGTIAPRGLYGAESEPSIQSVAGPISSAGLGVTLIHEHITADLRPVAERLFGDYDREEASRVTLPFLKELHELGCATLVDPTPMNMGRDPLLLRRLSEEVHISIVCATGLFAAHGGKFLPDYAFRETAEQIGARYVREIRSGIRDTRIRPGLIKTGVDPENPLSSVARRLITAAAFAQRETGLTIASHTGPGLRAFEQLDILESLGVPPSAFIWVHADNEKDHRMHVQAARLGAWVEFDSLNRPDFLEWHLKCISAMAEAGSLDRALISHDAGWYQPGKPNGGSYRGYTPIFTKFVPRLREVGFSRADLDQLLIKNPARALTGVLA